MRHAPLGNVQVAQHLDARKHRRVPLLRDRLHGMLQHAVNPVLHRHFRIPRFDVNIARAALQRGEDNRLHQAHHRTHRGVASQAVAGNRLFAFFLVLGHLQREGLRRLFQHALGLLRALQQVANLPRCGDLIRQFLSQQQRQFIAKDHHAGIRNRNHQRTVVHHRGTKL